MNIQGEGWTCVYEYVHTGLVGGCLDILSWRIEVGCDFFFHLLKLYGDF